MSEKKLNKIDLNRSLHHCLQDHQEGQKTTSLFYFYTRNSSPKKKSPPTFIEKDDGSLTESSIEMNQILLEKHSPGCELKGTSRGLR